MLTTDPANPMTKPRNQGDWTHVKDLYVNPAINGAPYIRRLLLSYEQGDAPSDTSGIPFGLMGSPVASNTNPSNSVFQYRLSSNEGSICFDK